MSDMNLIMNLIRGLADDPAVKKLVGSGVGKLSEYAPRVGEFISEYGPDAINIGKNVADSFQNSSRDDNIAQIDDKQRGLLLFGNSQPPLNKNEGLLQYGNSRPRPPQAPPVIKVDYQKRGLHRTQFPTELPNIRTLPQKRDPPNAFPTYYAEQQPASKTIAQFGPNFRSTAPNLLPGQKPKTLPKQRTPVPKRVIKAVPDYQADYEKLKAKNRAKKAAAAKKKAEKAKQKVKPPKLMTTQITKNKKKK